MNIRLFALLAAIAFATTSLFAADAIPLWPDGAPGSEGKTAPEKEDASHNVTSVHNPSITPLLVQRQRSGIC